MWLIAHEHWAFYLNLFNLKIPWYRSGLPFQPSVVGKGGERKFGSEDLSQNNFPRCVNGLTQYAIAKNQYLYK